MWKFMLAATLIGYLLLCCQATGKTAGPPANMSLLMEETSKRFRAAAITVGRINAYRPGEPPNTWECERITAVPQSVRQAMKLSSFYKKYLHAFGIPILSSNRVKDSALRRACYVVTFTMADRLDFRRYFFRRNGRAAVIAHQVEQVTTIPEHSWLPAWWNRRARGLGGTIQQPISTCGEENLLCYRSDPWKREDIFLHEFVHGIHNVAIASNGAIKDFDRRLNRRYRYLKQTGKLWAKTYAMSTDREYLAEGAQSYFDVDADVNPPDGIHNFVNTRAELKAYDPVLYNFCREVFPCGNKIVDRCDETSQATIPAERWHFRMNCNKDGSGGIWMDFKTKRPVGSKPTPSVTQQPEPPTPPQTPHPSTDLPTGSPPLPQTPHPSTDLPTGSPPLPQTPHPSTDLPTGSPPLPQTPHPSTDLPTGSPPLPQTPPPPQTKPPTTQKPSSCYDKNRSCPYWASIGECYRNPGYMHVNCRRSCRRCGGGGGGCVDRNRMCASWSRYGYCNSNTYVKNNCKKSCRLCFRWG